MQLITVRGPHGSFKVNQFDGNIVGPIPQAYHYYRWADLQEYREWAKANDVSLDTVVPILCIGVRTQYGRVHPAVTCWREEWLSDLRASQGRNTH